MRKVFKKPVAESSPGQLLFENKESLAWRCKGVLIHRDIVIETGILRLQCMYVLLSIFEKRG